MTLRRACAALATALAVLLLGGCVSQPDPKDAAASLRQERATIVAALRGVAADLAKGGGTVTEATGAYLSCGSAPTYAIEYRAGAKLPSDGAPIGTRIRAAVTTLQASGWKVTDATYTDDPYPNARLAKDGLKLALDPDARRGSDAMTFGLSGRCVRTAKGQDTEFGGQEQLDLGASAG
jgi:hypothetical protein